MAITTKPFDAAEYLDDAESQAELLSDAFASGDAGYIAHALGIIARARGMTEIARQAGLRARHSTRHSQKVETRAFRPCWA